MTQGKRERHGALISSRITSVGALAARLSISPILGAKARAILHGRPYVSTEDVLAVARPVLRHRIITNFNAEAEGIKSDEIVKRLAALIPHDPGRAEGRAAGYQTCSEAAGSAQVDESRV